MCGRSSLHEEPVALLEAYGLPVRLPAYRPRYNITPSEIQWTILLGSDGALEARGLTWGLVPSWANDPSVGPKLINARAETISEKPSYRDSLQLRRCLVITDGYYEWAKSRTGKTPYRFQMQDEKAFVMAGLWDRWTKGPVSLESCTVITTPASAAAAHVHHRMPAILNFEDSLKWLNPKTTQTELLGLLHPYDGPDLDMFEVSRAVNSPANDTADCLLRFDSSAVRAESEEQGSLAL